MALIKREILYGKPLWPDFEGWSRDQKIAAMKRAPGKRIVMLKGGKPYRFIKLNNAQLALYQALRELCDSLGTNTIDLTVILKAKAVNRKTVIILITKGLLELSNDNKSVIVKD